MGLIISTTMTLETAMLIEINVDSIAYNFANPIALLCMGVVSGFVGAYFSVTPLKKVSIANIDRLK